MGEMITVAAYQLKIKIIVIKNNSLDQIKWDKWFFSATLNMHAICSPQIL